MGGNNQTMESTITAVKKMPRLVSVVLIVLVGIAVSSKELKGCFILHDDRELSTLPLDNFLSGVFSWKPLMINI